MKVLVATEKPFAIAAVEGIREVVEAEGHELMLLEKYTDKAQLLSAVEDADAMIIRSDKVDEEVFNAAKKRQIVVRAGAGYDTMLWLKTRRDKTQMLLQNLCLDYLLWLYVTSIMVNQVLS